MQAKITNGQVDTFPYSVGALRRDNPNTSFPKVLSHELLEEYGIVDVTEEYPPLFDAASQRLERDTQPFLSDGYWQVGWHVVELSENEVHDNNWRVEEDNRNLRNLLLTQSDWTQVEDAPVNKEDWALYRQELRDLTYSEQWPHIDESSWPVEPLR